MIRKRFLILLFILPVLVCVSSTPPDHLIPPVSTHQRILPPIYRIPQSNPPGLMQRIARWFGFDNQSKDQNVQANNFQSQYKSGPYNYNRPQVPCNSCNKAPWVPMFISGGQFPIPNGIPVQTQQQQLKQQQYHANQQFNANYPQQQHVPVSAYTPSPQSFHQYAPGQNFPPNNVPAFHFVPPLAPRNPHSNYLPPANLLPIEQRPHQLIPIPIPNLSITPIPPLYDPIPFHSHVNDKTKFLEPIAQLSQNQEFRPNVIPGSGSKNHDGVEPNFEIFQSIPLHEFVSSVDYPVNVEQSPVIDLTLNQPQIPHQQNQQASVPNFIPSPNPIHNEIPKLTELGSYAPTEVPHTNFISKPIVVPQQNLDIDSYPEASSHNISYRQENILDISNYVSVPPQGSFSPTEFVSSTVLPPTIQNVHNFDTSTKPFINVDSSVHTNSERPNQFRRDRETPKNLLDSPIYYQSGSSPRPFTSDPRELNFHSSTHRHHDWQQSSTPTPWAFVPTPTSTYSSVDASGRFAGMSPPVKFQPSPVPFNTYSSSTEKSQKPIHQIIIPYTSKNKPSPFKAREEQSDQENDARFPNWSSSHEADFHEQQESKLVTATETPNKKPTKYFTKILVSNLRELLKQEHESKDKNQLPFDIEKLRQNIDGWTEEQFTSLLNKASTVSMWGPSKNIPPEYLTTTPLSIVSTTRGTEPPTTELDNLLTDNEVKKYDFLSKLVEDNQIVKPYPTVSIAEKNTVTTASPQDDSAVSPFYSRTIVPTESQNEVWNSVKVSISPLTKEKVYVVTPQPKVQYAATSPEPIGTFKSPRFLVRPTPGTGVSQNASSSNNTDTARSTSRSFTPELFGQLANSAYSPPVSPEKPIGFSKVKVLTIVTPSSDARISSDNEGSHLTDKQIKTKSPTNS